MASFPRNLATRLLRYLLRARSEAKSRAELVGELAGEISSTLDRETALKLKDGIRVPAPLDYSKSDISLDLRSAGELVRLSASKKEPWTVSWIESMQGGDVLYDVGANVGAYSLIAARQPGRIRVLAFEPSFENYAALCRNVVHNRCESLVIALPIALGSRTGIDTFNYHALDPGTALHTLGASIDYRGQPFEPRFRQQIVSMRLDDAVRLLGLPVPSHVKIDVDGTEMEVLQGALQTLSDPICRSLLIEICEYKVPSKDIVAFLEGHRFALAERHDRPSPPGKLPEVSYLEFRR